MLKWLSSDICASVIGSFEDHKMCNFLRAPRTAADDKKKKKPNVNESPNLARLLQLPRDILGFNFIP